MHQKVCIQDVNISIWHNSTNTIKIETNANVYVSKCYVTKKDLCKEGIHAIKTHESVDVLP